MHAGEPWIDASLVRRLLAAQLPQWAGLPLRRVESAGTDNAIFRLGDDLAVRLPRIGWAVAQVEKEHRWLPRLAPHLPLPIPEPLALGVPGAGYPWPWAVHRWLAGEDALAAPVADLRQAAIDLARFIAALQRIDPAGGPRAGEASSRGVPLATRDAAVRAAIAALRRDIDGPAVTAAWEAALAAPAWDRPGVWLHGDLTAVNLLVRDGRLAAVIDFGPLAVGDPAADVMTAWLYLDRGARAIFRETLQVDDATWARAKGWALSVGLIILPYYRDTNPVLCGIGARAIEHVLEDR